jgi:hypothetical protein
VEMSHCSSWLTRNIAHAARFGGLIEVQTTP